MLQLLCYTGSALYSFLHAFFTQTPDSDTGSGELSGDGDSTSGDVTPLAPFTPLDDEAGNTSVTTIGPEQSERPDGHELEDVADHPDPVTPNPGQGSFTDMISDDYTTETPRPSTPPANSDYGRLSQNSISRSNISRTHGKGNKMIKWPISNCLHFHS